MATIKALIIEPDGTSRVTEIENELASFQAIVGGYIEVVMSGMASIYVNEEGLILNQPFNPLATLFAYRVLGLNSPLHGPALIVGPPDSNGNDTHVHQSVIDSFNTMEN